MAQNSQQTLVHPVRQIKACSREGEGLEGKRFFFLTSRDEQKNKKLLLKLSLSLP
jgi:hypothetical protein